VNKRLLVVGLTGGIGSGKSTVASIFQELGARGMDADAVGHRVLDQPEVVRRLVKAWGPSIVAQGKVDRRALAALAFRTPGDVRRLNAAVHPAIRRELMARIRRERRTGGIFILDAALLLEAGIQDWCDRIVYVDVPRAVRLRRVKGRGWNAGELHRRERWQWPVARKRAASDYVIRNGGPMAATRNQVRVVFKDLLGLLGPS
jgi:dephospho-CoA kinase